MLDSSVAFNNSFNMNTLCEMITKEVREQLARERDISVGSLDEVLVEETLRRLALELAKKAVEL